MNKKAIDASLLIMRIVVGIIFAAHGAQHLFGAFNGPGLKGTVDMLGPVGYLVAIGEFFGGIGIVFGFLSTTSFNFAYFVLTSPDAYAGGRAFQSTDSGATYIPLNSKNLDWAFDVQEVPEPTHFIVPVLALGGLVRRRTPTAV